jgi:GNAT superfamily N-acetyltransferase
MDIRPATRDDVEVLIEQLKDAPAAQHHIRERWGVQERDEGVFLLAHDEGIVGQTMVLRHSRYAEVVAADDPAEINGLHAFPRGRGVGTALVQAAEEVTAGWGRAVIGLAVELDNERARRLYERLGYQLWAGPRVIDRWTEKDADGVVVRSHADLCDYLFKRF